MLVVDFEKLVSNMMFPDMRSRPGGKPEFFTVETKSGFQQAVLVEILEAGELKPPTAGAGKPPTSEDLFTNGFYYRILSLLDCSFA